MYIILGIILLVIIILYVRATDAEDAVYYEKKLSEHKKSITSMKDEKR